MAHRVSLEEVWYLLWFVLKDLHEGEEGTVRHLALPDEGVVLEKILFRLTRGVMSAPKFSPLALVTDKAIARN
jgi:hypothetical protein